MFVNREATMPCKFCGVQWKKDVTDEELETEITRRNTERARRESVRIFERESAKQAYLDRIWPTHSRAGWLGFANLIVAMLVVGLAGNSIKSYARDTFGAFWEPVALLVAFCAFLVIYAPGIVIILKERRILAKFREEHPEYYDTP